MGSLLTVAPPSPEFPRGVLDAPGGFMWWYADMIDAGGNGLVLIWSFGLPFLPGYAGAARRGEPQKPQDRPSLSVALFEAGKLVCYLLHEFDPGEAQWEGSHWRFGASTFDTVVVDGVRSLHVELDCPLPGDQQLTGTVVLRGVARLASTDDRQELHHDWSPLTGPAEGRARLWAGDLAYTYDGRGYFDGNAGAKPLHDTGIAAWTWGRIPFEDHEAIYYVLWRELDASPQASGVIIDAEGQLRRLQLAVDVESESLGLAGLRYPSRLRLSTIDGPWLSVTAQSRLDDGPFYLRYLIEAQGAAHDPVIGIGEYCRTDRIDLARHRPLVRMRVQRGDGDNSIWLPLFAGPRPGRVQRLLRQFVER